MMARLGRLAVFVSLGLAGAACGDGDSGEPSAAIQAWGLGSSGRRDVSVEEAAGGCNTVVVFAIDRVTKRELPMEVHAEGTRPSASGTPNIDGIAAGAVVVPDALAASTGGNASLASLLTGLAADEHGVGSLRDPGRARLDPARQTLAETLSAGGWHTMASMSSARQARGFSGLEQGFEDYAAPSIGERGRDAATVARAIEVAMNSQLDGDGKVFALYSFDGPGGRLDALALEPALVVPHVKARLEPLRARHAEVDAALLRIDTDPGKTLGELATMLRRARGSDLANAWAMAQRDAKLAAMDDAIGSVLDQLDEYGRAEHAMVVVVGTRGDLLPIDRVEGGARLAPELIEIPMALRYPCGAAAEIPEGPLSITDVPRRIAGAFGLGGAASADGSDVDVFDTKFSVRSQVEQNALVEFYDDYQAITFERDGSRTRVMDLAGFLPDPRRIGLTLDVTETAPALKVEWLASEGRALDPLVDGEVASGSSRTPGARGSFDVTAGGGARTIQVPLTRRSAAVRMDVAAAATDRPILEYVAMGGQRTSALPVLLVPRDDAAVVPDGARPALSVDRGNGLWWKLAVAGEGETELIVSVWPPREPSDEFEVQAGGPVLAHDVPGRRDLVRLVGTAPFDLKVKKLGKERFAVACRQAGRFLGPHEMAFHGVWFGSESAASFVVADWQPEFSSTLGGVDAALYAVGADVPDGAWMQIGRFAPGGRPAADAAMDFVGLDFIKTLPPGE